MEEEEEFEFDPIPVLDLSGDSDASYDSDDATFRARFQEGFSQAAVQHTYFGDDEMEETHGSTFFEEGSVISLPIVSNQGIVLFPGQILPMTVDYPVLQKALQHNKTIAIICSEASSRQVGTTAEIVEYSCRRGIRIKARGRQRVQLISHISEPCELDDYNVTIMGQVKILPELILPRVVSDAQAPSLNRFRKNPNFRKSMRKMDIAAFPWPQWVVDDNDLPFVISKVIAKLKQLKIMKSCDIPPSNEVHMSYWVSKMLPIIEPYRVFLLGLDSALERFQYALFLLQKSEDVCCKHCTNFVAFSRHIFSSGIYCNPGGHLHDIVSLKKISGSHILSDETPTTLYSWFPGYAWLITLCGVCKNHLGWQFKAVDPELQPQEFWCVRKNAVTMHNSTAMHAE